MSIWSWLAAFGRRSPGRSSRPAVPAPVRTVAVVVGAHGQPVVDAMVTLTVGQAVTVGTTNADGYYAVPWVPAMATPCRVTVAARGFETYTATPTLPATNVELRIGVPVGPGPCVVLPALVPVVPPIAVPALRVRGQFFESVDGEHLTVIECTDFKLFLRYLDGEDIEPVLAERAAIGFNTLRIALTCRNMFSLDPDDEPGYYDKLAAFTQLLLGRGLRPEYVVFMDAPAVMPDLAAQRAFFGWVLDALRPFAPYVLIELVNEADQPANRLDTNAFARPDGFLASHGSNGSQAWPPGPPWAYATMHFNDAPEWWRKTGHNAMEVADAQHVPVLANENTRMPDRDASPAHAFDAAAGAALLAAGSCFHSPSGKMSELFSPTERVLAEAWVAGAKSIDLRFQDGRYSHPINLETPAILRAYARTLSTGESCAALIRR